MYILCLLHIVGEVRAAAAALEGQNFHFHKSRNGIIIPHFDRICKIAIFPSGLQNQLFFAYFSQTGIKLFAENIPK